MPLLRTSLLMSEPAGTLESLDELFALANAMEMEAANRYSELAEDMASQNKDSLARIFAQLAAAEREHVDSVERCCRRARAVVRSSGARVMPTGSAAGCRVRQHRAEVGQVGEFGHHLVVGQGETVGGV